MLFLLLACTADGDTGGTVTGPQDLSGYATAADLAALQEQLDAQAAELDELRTEVAGLDGGASADLQVSVSTGGCSYAVSGVVEYQTDVQVLTARAGVLDSDGGWAWSPVRYTVYEPATDDSAYVVMVRIACSELDGTGLGESAGFQVLYVDEE